MTNPPRRFVSFHLPLVVDQTSTRWIDRYLGGADAIGASVIGQEPSSEAGTERTPFYLPLGAKESVASHPMHPDYLPSLEHPRTIGPTLEGQVQTTCDLLVKIRRRKRPRGDPSDETMEFVGIIERSVKFPFPADFALHEPTPSLPSRAFAPKQFFPSQHPRQVPYRYHPNPVCLATCTSEYSRLRAKIRNIEVDFVSSHAVPTKPPDEYTSFIRGYFSEQERNTMKELLTERPIWRTTKLFEALVSRGCVRRDINRYLVWVYTFTISRGPFTQLRIRYGFDPSLHSSVSELQRIVFRFPKELKSWCQTLSNLSPAMIASIPNTAGWSESKELLFRDFLQRGTRFRAILVEEFDDEEFKKILRSGAQSKCDRLLPSGWYSKQSYARAQAFFMQALSLWIKDTVLPAVGDKLALHAEAHPLALKSDKADEELVDILREDLSERSDSGSGGEEAPMDDFGDDEEAWNFDINPENL